MDFSKAKPLPYRHVKMSAERATSPFNFCLFSSRQAKLKVDRIGAFPGLLVPNPLAETIAIFNSVPEIESEFAC